MKARMAALPYVFSALLLLASCGGPRAANPITGATPAPVLPTMPPSAAAAPSSASSLPDGPAVTPPPLLPSAEGVDIDLTVLNANLVYAQVFAMMDSPSDFEGKVVRMTGDFAVYQGNPNNPDGAPFYYACVIKDALACCSQGMEFVWEGDHAYPEAYPAEGSTITVTGVYETYVENNYTFGRIRASTLETA